MPNHFAVVGLCAVEWTKLETQGKDVPDLTGLKGANLCELASPRPSDLDDIVSTDPPCRYRHKTTGEWHQSTNSPHGPDHNEWERINLTKAEQVDLLAKHGAATWYEWQKENWGTKWGTYGLKVRQLDGDGSPVLIEFQCAWGPPNPETMRRINEYLHNTYCLTNITWIGHDPYDCTTCAIAVFSGAIA